MGLPLVSRKLIAVPSFTFTATACAIRWAGFEPLFVDIEPDSWQLAPEALAQALDRYEGCVAGVLGCSTFGTAAPTAVRDRWRRLCADADMPLLIDSAAGFGGLDDGGRPLGAQGDTEVFSFHATKPFAIGEGGAVVTSDPDLAERITRLINFGIDPETRTSATVGLNAKMSELHAATGLAMLDRFTDVLDRRRATARQLQALFSSQPLTYQAGSDSSTWQVFQLLDAHAAEPPARAHPRVCRTTSRCAPALTRRCTAIPHSTAPRSQAISPSPTTSPRARSRCRWPIRWDRGRWSGWAD